MEKRIALLDCNNFYVSCERVFNPRLRGVPVAILSNNDGVVISLSEEMKAMGYRLGVVYHLHRKELEAKGIQILSSNYTLYGDMSIRFAKVLEFFCPEIEAYSIDECFLDLTSLQKRHHLPDYCVHLRREVYRQLGLPIGVGLSYTKTLAKLANRMAKKGIGREGCHALLDSEDIRQVLQEKSVEQVWGIGRRNAAKLYKMGCYTAWDVVQLPDKAVKKYFTIVGQRTAWELRGVSVIPIVNARTQHQHMISTRSFGRGVTQLAEMRASVAMHVAHLAAKLRCQRQLATRLGLMILTNRHRTEDIQYRETRWVQWTEPTNNTLTLLHIAMQLLDDIWLPDLRYKKSGVMLDGLVAEEQMQGLLFGNGEGEGQRTLMQTVDKLNVRYGQRAVYVATLGNMRERPGWAMRQNLLSPAYTTRWHQLPTASCD